MKTTNVDKLANDYSEIPKTPIEIEFIECLRCNSDIGLVGGILPSDFTGLPEGYTTSEISLGIYELIKK